MMYPYLTLDDETEIVHSELLKDNTVKVYIEKPDESDGFHFASCYLPGYEWKDISGFSEEEIIPNNYRKQCPFDYRIIAKWLDFFGELTYYC